MPWRLGGFLNAFGGMKPFLAIVAVAFLSAWLLLAQGLQPAERAYINFRHSKNLLQEGVLSFSVQGQPVLATESPLFAATLAAFSALFRTQQIDQAALNLNACLLLLIVVLSFLLTREMFQEDFPALLAATLIGFQSASIAIYAEGFEGAMLLFVVLSSFFLAAKGVTVAALLVASIAPLVSPDGIAAALLVPAYLILSGNRGPALFSFILIPAIWILFCEWNYGSVLPYSLKAHYFLSAFSRATEPGPGEHFLNTLSAVGRLCTSGHVLLYSGEFHGSQFSIPVFLRFVIGLLGCTVWLRNRRKKTDLKILFLFYPFLFLLVHVWFPVGHWNFASFLCFGLLFYFYVWVCGLRDFLARKNLHRKLAYLILFLVFFSANSYRINLWSGPLLQAREPRGSEWVRWELQRYNGYRRAVEYLKRNEAAKKSVVIAEAGFFGYAYPGNIVDGTALYTPEALRFYPPPDSDFYDEKGRRFSRSKRMIPSQLIREMKPDYVVSSAIYIRHLLRSNSDFLQEYVQVTRAGYVWGVPLYIFRRKS